MLDIILYTLQAFHHERQESIDPQSALPSVRLGQGACLSELFAPSWPCRRRYLHEKKANTPQLLKGLHETTVKLTRTRHTTLATYPGGRFLGSPSKHVKTTSASFAVSSQTTTARPTKLYVCRQKCMPEQGTWTLPYQTEVLWIPRKKP